MAKKPNGGSANQDMCKLKDPAGVFRNLIVSIAQIASESKKDRASVTRMKNGEPVRRTTAIAVINAINTLAMKNLDPDKDLVDA